MSLVNQIAKQFRDVHFGGNWTSSNLKDNLACITWQQATTRLDSLNTIVALVYHMNYYVSAVLKVLQGEPLTAKDKYSFDHPPVQSEEDWQKLLNKTWVDAENFAAAIEKLPGSKLNEIFVDEKYGTYYRNLAGITEHIHYHLGQIVLIKKMLQQSNNKQA
ncbi:MAG: DinB family protein [Bacteroidetes bacterium]|nr:MAG: DinB family protein [Bacteroidota bacterium]